MALDAALFYSDNYFALNLYWGEPRDRISDLPPVPEYDPQSRIWLEWDGEKLENDEFEFVGLTVAHLDELTEEDIANLAKVSLPRVSVCEVGLVDVEVADVLRWAMRTYHGQGVYRLGWDPPITQEAG